MSQDNKSPSTHHRCLCPLSLVEGDALSSLSHTHKHITQVALTGKNLCHMEISRGKPVKGQYLSSGLQVIHQQHRI